jgi:hypothetical protein
VWLVADCNTVQFSPCAVSCCCHFLSFSFVYSLFWDGGNIHTCSRLIRQQTPLLPLTPAQWWSRYKCQRKVCKDNFWKQNFNLLKYIPKATICKCAKWHSNYHLLYNACFSLIQLANLFQPSRLRGPALWVYRGPRSRSARGQTGIGLARPRGHPAEHARPQGEPGGRGHQGKGTPMQARIKDPARWAVSRNMNPQQHNNNNNKSSIFNSAGWFKCLKYYLLAFFLLVFSALGESVPGEREAVHGQGEDDHGQAHPRPTLPATARLSRKVPRMCSPGMKEILIICALAIRPLSWADNVMIFETHFMACLECFPSSSW